MPLNTPDFELLLQANRILSSKLNLDDVLQAVMEMATKIVRAEASSLLLLDEAKNELYFDLALGSAKDRVKQIRLKVGEGVAGWVAKERKPLIVNDVTKDKRFTVKVDKSTKFKTKSILAIPLLAMGKMVGVIEALNKEYQQEFSQQDLETFEAFASQAAIAIENARLFSEVQREKEKLNTILSEMSEGVVLIDDDQRILFLNQASRRFLDLEDKDVVGQRFEASLLTDFEKVDPSLNETKILYRLEEPIELRRRKGKDFFLSIWAHHLEATKRLPQGGAVIVLRDVTEERRGEHLKRNFLSLISHKLKTPLTVILGYSPTLASNPEGMNPFQKKAVDSIYKQSQQLGGLVDKLLRFTLVESESLDKKLKATNLGPLINDIAKEEPAVSVSEGLAKLPNVFIDVNLTKEVIKNLIENGLKFNSNQKKSIAISGKKKGNEVEIQITDNGVGIPSEEMEKVFQKFYQIENSFTGQVPGAGLGLPLSKRIMEEMGGKIKLHSDLGQGTTATLFFPIKSK